MRNDYANLLANQVANQLANQVANCLVNGMANCLATRLRNDSTEVLGPEAAIRAATHLPHR